MIADRSGSRRWTFVGGLVAASLLLIIAGVVVSVGGSETQTAAKPGETVTSLPSTETTAVETPSPTTALVDAEPVEETSAAVFDFADPSSLSSSYEVGLYHRDDVLISQESWSGDYAPGGAGECSGPEEKRQIQRGERATGFNQDWIYQCDAPGGDQLVVTSIGDTSGYSIGSFSPKESFSEVSEIRWDVNITDLGNRQWTEVAVIPEANFDPQNPPCSIGQVSCDGPDHSQLNSVGVSFFQQKMFINPGEVDAIDVLDKPWSQLNPEDGEEGGAASKTNISTRRTHYLKQGVDGDGQAVLIFGIERADGTFLERSTVGAFPSGPVRVVFADHNFTPMKSESGTPATFSWHWDNISVS